MFLEIERAARHNAALLEKLKRERDKNKTRWKEVRDGFFGRHLIKVIINASNK
jgi:hypothetical protein